MTFKSVHQAADDQYAAIYTGAIVATGTRTGALFLNGRAPIRLIMPALWAATAAQVRVQLSEDGVSYLPLWAAGTAYTVAVQKSQAVRIDPETFGGVAYIRLVGTTAKGTAAAQSTAVTVGIVARLI
jgi:hypothetical protein